MFWNKIKDRAPEIILFSAVGFLQFFRLGIGEIQSWDEARYILRAEACIRYGTWLDQTKYAIGGLYSSNHPPLIVWLMAIIRMLFGNSVFAARIVAAIAGVIGLIFFYKLAGRFFSRWTRLAAVACLGSAQGYLWFSHLSQFDIPMFVFIVASVYYAVRSFEEGNSEFAVVAGIMFGCALISKAVQGVYLLPFLLALPYIFRTKKWLRNLILLLGTALIIALPWYIYMAIIHPDYISSTTELIGSLKNGSYTRIVKTQWWYYLNQTSINFPLLILGLLTLPMMVRKWKQRDSVYARLSMISFLWFVGMIIFLSSFQTRMAHFSMFLLLPSTLTLSIIVEEYLRPPVKATQIFVSIALIGFSIAWSASELVRKSIREYSIPSMHGDFFAILGLFVFFVAIVLFLKRNYPISVQANILIGASLILVAVEFYRWGSRDNETYVDGAEKVGSILLHMPEIHSLTAYHDDFPHELYLPQLNYYTDSWLVGWDTSKSSQTKTWDELDSLIKVDNVPKSDAAVIYVSWDEFYKPTQAEHDRSIRINQGLSARYSKVLHTKKYQLYWEQKQK